MIFDMLQDILEGLKKIAIGLLLIALCASVGYGVISAILVISGKMTFAWYDIPCWLICFLGLAGVIGSARD